MRYMTDDLRIREIKELSPPAHLIREFPCEDVASVTVHESRQAIHRILHGMDDRLVVVIGPCSIHDPSAALDYARKLKAERDRHAADLEIVMRVYFEKPRTTVGWKGLINDPDMDGSFRINHGLRVARELLMEINAAGLPAGCEYLDMITPQYIADFVAWGAIGARTTESQVHRELASGLSCPVGFKNGTDGNIRIAVRRDQGRAAAASLPLGHEGRAFGHRLDQGQRGLPHHPARRQAAELRRGQRRGRVRRARQGGSCAAPDDRRQPCQQPEGSRQPGAVCENIAQQLAAGDDRIIGVMVESHLIAGRQDHVPGKPLTYGQSITDACIGWEDSVRVLEILADGVRQRRLKATGYTGK